MNWKIIVVVLGIILIGGIISFFLLTPVDNIITDISPQITKFMESPNRKLNIELTREEFDNINPNEFTLYYFPGECPSYTEDIMLYEKTKDGNKYYLPETKCLIKLPNDMHDWTKILSDDKFWVKRSEQEINYNVIKNEQADSSRSIQEHTELSSK